MAPSIFLPPLAVAFDVFLYVDRHCGLGPAQEVIFQKVGDAEPNIDLGRAIGKQGILLVYLFKLVEACIFGQVVRSAFVYFPFEAMFLLVNYVYGVVLGGYSVIIVLIIEQQLAVDFAYYLALFLSGHIVHLIFDVREDLETPVDWRVNNN